MKFNKYNFIGIFDSGIGGISVLNSIINYMPFENYIYFADSKNFPYGKKSKKAITDIGLNILSEFNKLHAKEVVIACNTMSTSNMPLFKNKFTDINIIGTFPDLTQIFKTPSVVISNKTIFYDKDSGPRLSRSNLKVLIIATSATSKSEYLQNQIDTFSEFVDIYVESADFIVKAVENNRLDTYEFKNNISDLLKEYYDIDYLVLGCTHFHHVKHLLEKHINSNVKIISGSDITSKEAFDYLSKNSLINKNNEPFIKIIDYSLDNDKTNLYKKLLITNTHHIEFYKEFCDLQN